MAQPLTPEDIARAREAGVTDEALRWLQTVQVELAERLFQCVKIAINDKCPRCLKNKDDCRGYSFCPKWNKMRPCDCSDEYCDMLNKLEDRSAKEKDG